MNYLARPERFELPTPWFVACIGSGASADNSLRSAAEALKDLSSGTGNGLK